MDPADLEINFIHKIRKTIKSFSILICALTFFNVSAQEIPLVQPSAVVGDKPVAEVTTEDEKPEPIEEVEEGGGNPIKLLRGKPNARRIKRHLNLISGIKHDEELLIPSTALNYKGNVELAEITRIKGTDQFRILPAKPGNGIITIHDKKTGQILVELRFDIRDQEIERSLREIKAMLSDIDGIEFKIVNGIIILDGFVLLPKDLIRIAQVIKQAELDTKQVGKVKNLVSLSPVARKKIIEYIAREVNNPEVTITAIGDFVKLEGVVNSADERSRVVDIVNMYLPDIVTDKAPELGNVEIRGRRISGTAESFIINLITVRPAEEKVEPPPKMIQVVVHFVEFSDRYSRNFNFIFSPSITGIGQAATSERAPTSIGEIASIVNNLLPKINWARNHGYVRVLDTASVLTQDKLPATISRSFQFNNNVFSISSAGQPQGGAGGGANSGNLSVGVTPQIKSERTGLIQMGLNVNIKPVNPGGTFSLTADTTVNTTISVRDRSSAAFGGIISKKAGNDFGGPSNTENAIITLNHGKKVEKNSSNFVVFVTPVIKSTASAGVEQVKKKFRMKDSN